MRKNGRVPMRTCAGCREKKDKKELLRIVRQPDGTVLADPTGRRNGRGTYICRSTACLEKARKSKNLSRVLQVAVPEEVYKELALEIERELSIG